MRTAARLCLVLAGIVLVNCAGPGENWSDIEAGFQNPPNSAKPRVWWHWMNGNVTKPGIRSDLEWMSRTGIGGFQNFDAGLSSPQIVEERLVYMTPEWKDAFSFATHLADSLGLEMAVAASPGWSETGGPWVTPEEGMKKYVWSEIQVEGGQPFSGTLPHPPEVTGAFQNITGGRRGFGAMAEGMGEVEQYYADAAVVAFRIPDADVSITERNPEVTASGGQFSLQSLTDGDLMQATPLPSAPVGQKSWIQFEFDEPQTIRGLTLVTSGGGRRMGPFGGGSPTQTIETSDDGNHFTVITEIPGGRSSQNTHTFPPQTARFFRFSVLTPEPPAVPDARMFGGFGLRQEGPSGTQIAELVLHAGPRVNRYEDKAGFSTAAGLTEIATPSASNTDVVSKDDVIDLTAQMSADGTLNWTPPDGKWVILRLGYSLIGTTNHPASPEATGLEVDKLNAADVTSYMTQFLDQYEDATGGLMGRRGLEYIITDSWEAGAANWTDDMIEEFDSRNGYSMIDWLPVLTGHVVESAEASDRFLWDFRMTLGALVAEYHYDLITELLHQRGMGRYSESHEGGRAFIGDGMEVKRTADVPMSATWVPGGFGGSEAEGVAVRHKADMRESASVAHIYGQNLVAAESMTAGANPWDYYPEKLKPTADMEMANGLNRFVIHCSVHQPVDDKIPGLTLGPFGQWFTRHETWAEMAKPWITYLGRSSYLLQQGKAVADVIYLYGEDYNITALFGDELPDVPQGYEYDFVNADALTHVMSVSQGRIVSPGGTSYRLLALDESTRDMSVPVIRKIKQLVEAGALAVGPKPVKTPSLNDDDAEFNAIAEELWGTGTGVQSIGNGRVYAGQTVAEVLNELEIEPDFSYTKPDSETEILYVHRSLNDGEIYWLNNRSNRYETVTASFRVAGRAAEIWDPETGDIKQASYTIEDGRTTVPLTLKPNDAVLVVFREETVTPSRTIAVPEETTLGTVGGPWQVDFQSGRGAPSSITLENLTPWNESSNAGVKYFSGVGTYTKTVEVPAEWLASDREIWLDLGDVKYLAEVIVNDQSMGTVWKTPYHVNITTALHEGENSLVIKVANLWVNRIIGDLQPGVTQPVTFTAQHTYREDSPLLPSGLLGPVRLIGLSNQ
jgi:hypothetical protein